MIYCPECNSCNVKIEQTLHRFPYKNNEGIEIELTCYVPMIECQDCEEQFLDYRSEEIIDSTVLDYEFSKKD